MSKDSLHGLIADTVDLGITTWWDGTYTVTGATGRTIGTGKANTKKYIVTRYNRKLRSTAVQEI